MKKGKKYAEAFKQIDEYWMQNMDTDNGRLVDVENLDKLNISIFSRYK